MKTRNIIILSLSALLAVSCHDNGNWDVYYARGNNAYWDRDKEFPIHFNNWKDIKDETYWNCVTEEEDREAADELAYDYRMLSDGSVYYQEPV